ncbi:MAG: PadR family transcriptional regulator [Gemmatimonadota bacterium]|nr:PadR family transcriptional regulator [Gemmatimonadota bacterium]
MDPKTFLPLTPVAFEILLALRNGALHGYAVMQAVNEASPRRVHPGTLYRAVARLVDEGLLAEEGVESEGRRSYRITGLGRRVAAAEAARVAGQVERAQGIQKPARWPREA